MKVLIVDDSTIVRNRLKDILSEVIEHKNISQAKNSLEAVSSFKKLGPEVVILDIQMPGGSGIDAIAKMKAATKPPVVIILTNYPYPQYRRKCMVAGADFFFDKSTEFNKVTDVLNRLKQNQPIQ